MKVGFTDTRFDIVKQCQFAIGNIVVSALEDSCIQRNFKIAVLKLL